VGTFDVTVNVQTGIPPYPLIGTMSFDAASFPVPGSLAPGGIVNLGVLVGDMQVLGSTFGDPAGSGATGTVVGTQTALSDPSLLDMDLSGQFICPGPVGCAGDFGAAFIHDVTNMTGSLISDGTLPADGPDSAYKEDGDATCTTLYDIYGYPYQVHCTGVFGLNVFFAANTPEGSDVTVDTSTSFFTPITGVEVPVDVEVTYATVPPGGGATIVTATSSAAGGLSSDFAVQVGDFSVAFFDVSTDFTPTGPITICSSYPDADDDGIVDGTDAGGGPGVVECAMRILHLEAGSFVDRTLLADDPACQPSIPLADRCAGASPPCIDEAANRICAQVSDLSFFGVFPRVVPQPIALDVDVRPLSSRNRINAASGVPVPVAILGAANVDVDEIDVTSLAFGPPGAPGAAPAFDLTDPLVLFLSRFDVNQDSYVDLVPSFVPRDTGLAVGDTEACVSGTIGGQPFEGCDVVEVVERACGLGVELVGLLPPLAWWRRRRSRRRA